MKNNIGFVLAFIATTLSCTRLDLVEPAAVARGLSAPCVANVEGAGEIDVELDYLPHVIACENGAADYEALRAQAVAARSYLAYKIDRSPGTPIQDGTGDQVYTCANAPGAIHYEAVATTSGEILRYADTVVAAFYVAGAIPTAASCIAGEGDNDYSNTEHYVTVNDGRSALGITQTTLGFVAPTNWANRGCHSQNGANCLSEIGFGYDDILRFYYGTDIEVVVGEGDCVAPDDGAYVCGALSSSGATTIDPTHACFVSGCASSTLGPDGAVSALYGTARAERDCFGRWRLSFDDAGAYDVAMQVPDVEDLASGVTVVVRHAGAESTVVVDQNASRGLTVPLGTFAFAKGRHQWIEIDDATGEEGDPSTGPFVAFPQILIAPAGSMLDDAGQHDVDGGVVAYEDGGVGAEDAGPPLPPSVVACACTSMTRDAPAALCALLALFLCGARKRPRRRNTSNL